MKRRQNCLKGIKEVTIMGKIKAYDGAMIKERDVTVVSARPGTPTYNIPAMTEYAKRESRKMTDLTDNERARFITGYHK